MLFGIKITKNDIDFLELALQLIINKNSNNTQRPSLPSHDVTTRVKEIYELIPIKRKIINFAENYLDYFSFSRIDKIIQELLW